MMRTGLIALVLATAAHASVVKGADAPRGEPTGAEPLVAAAVASMLSNYHYEQMPLDDDISARWLDTYVDDLDPSHMVFLQSDIQEFQKWRGTLDDDVRAYQPELTAAFTIYDRFEQRYRERIEHATALLQGDVDVTDDEVMVYERTHAPWPATAAEANELWRMRVEDAVIVGLLRDEPLDDVKHDLIERYDRTVNDLEQNGALDVLEYYLTALGEVYDPHTVYMKPASNDNFDIDMSNSVTGIGAQLRVRGPYTEVSEVIAGGPADLDGRLKAGDRIIAVTQGGPSEEPVDIVDRRLDDVVRLIRGKKGTTVTLTVIPADAADESDTSLIDIVRDRVVLEKTKAHLEVVNVDLPDGQPGKIAVVDVPSFYGAPEGQKIGTVTDDVRDLLGELPAGGVDAVVLDMRRNGGGLLSEAIRMTGLFIPSGPVVQVRDPTGEVEALADRDRGEVVYSGPLVVLTSQLSASATEIVAGALKDYGRAVIVGADTTHGKGTVQTLLNPAGEVRRLTSVNVGADLGVVKLTVQKFYLPSGSSTQLKGVSSDVVLPSPYDGAEISEAYLDNPLPWDEVAPARYSPVGDLHGVIAELKRRSAERVDTDPKLAKLAEEAAEAIKLQAETSTSLNLETRRAEREERLKLFGADDADEEKGDDAKRPDPVLDEAVRVAADLVDVLPR